MSALAISFGLAAAHPVAATPQDHSRDLRAIEDGERAFGQAFVTGDAAALERLLDPDFVGVGVHGQAAGKADFVRDAKAGPRITSDRVYDLKVVFHGDVAIAQGREAEVGPAPEFKPVWRVFTDTWIKTGGVWRVAAAEDLDPGAPTSADHQQDQADIIALRGQSNRAIAAHDLKAFTPVFADDAVFVWSNGTSAIGKAGLEAFFSRDFADPAFIAYIRTPGAVAVSENGLRAVEHGTWTALKRSEGGETRYGGDYAAHWFKGKDGWRIRGELYVKLRCQGPLCTP